MKAARATVLASLVLAHGLAGIDVARADAPQSDTWDFAVTLDGKPIGTHRFVVSGDVAQRTVDSSAQFDVKLLGITVYRYRHQARERWQGDCMRELQSSTDDDGKASTVGQRFDSECLMGFAYWNPRMTAQQRLVDPQTGRIENVRLERLGDAQIDMQGRPVAATGWRLLAAKQNITLWYAQPSGRWIALDAATAGGRTVSYRLPAVSQQATPP